MWLFRTVWRATEYTKTRATSDGPPHVVDGLPGPRHERRFQHLIRGGAARSPVRAYRVHTRGRLDEQQTRVISFYYIFLFLKKKKHPARTDNIQMSNGFFSSRHKTNFEKTTRSRRLRRLVNARIIHVLYTSYVCTFTTYARRRKRRLLQRPAVRIFRFARRPLTISSFPFD